jgi:FkbM family methyltransferase
MYTSQTQTLEPILDRLFPRPGTFLEIGCWDGEMISQTAYLERERGWTGVCVDPFPRNFRRRSCRVCEKAISRDGKPRLFVKVSRDRRHKGDVSYFSGFKDAIATHWPLISEHCDYEEMGIETITVSDLYARYDLPDYIDFLSVDTEGSELEIFQNIDFTVRSFGLIVFEHNENETVKQEIGKILTGHGYKLLESWRVDDVYVHPHIHQAWIRNEFKQWTLALSASTVHNFKDHPIVKRMLGDFDWPRKFQPGLNPADFELIRKIDDIGRVTPSEVSGPCWRMIYYALQVLARAPTSMVEIGGGAGQFYAILRALGYEGEYYILDLPEVKEFQNRYLQEVHRQTGLRFEQTLHYEFCVSFYALGEFDDQTKEWYVENVVKKCEHGFILWNPHSGASDVIDFPCTVKDEYPPQSPGNKQLEW